MPQNVYTFILRHSSKEQIVLLILAVVSYPFLYYSYDLPKTIINYITEVNQFVSKPANTGAIVPAQSMFGIELDHVRHTLTQRTGADRPAAQFDIAGIVEPFFVERQQCLEPAQAQRLEQGFVEFEVGI